MGEPVRKTLLDVVAHLLDVEDVSNDAVSMRRCLRAAVAGVTDVMQRHQWRRYTVDLKFTIAEGQNEIVLADDVRSVAWLGLASDVVSSYSSSLSSESFGSPKWSARTVGYQEVSSAEAVAGAEGYAYERFALFPRDGFGGFGETPGATIRLLDNSSQSRELFVRYHRYPVIPTLHMDLGKTTILQDSPTIARPTNMPSVDIDTRGAAIAISGTANSPEGHLGSQQHGFHTPVSQTLAVSGVGDSGINLSEDGPSIANRGSFLTQWIDLPHYAWQAITLFAETHFYRTGRGDKLEYFKSMAMADRQMKVTMAQETTTAISPVQAADLLGTSHTFGGLISVNTGASSE